LHRNTLRVSVRIFYSFIHLFSFSVVLGGVHCGIYKSSYNVSNISYLNSSPQPLSFIVPPWLMEQFQQVSFFHLHTCLYITWTLFTLLSLPLPPPLLHCCPHPAPQHLLGLFILQFCRWKEIKDKKKNMTFCKFEIKLATQGASLCCFHAYMFTNWFTSSSSLHSSLVHFP
jgi:hypothetical protein